MDSSRKQGILHAHLAALLFGGTALFAKVITLPADVITFWRTAVALVTIVVICKLRGQSLRLGNKRDVCIQIGLGGILGIHWATYYASIQLSTVAIGITALFTAPIISVFIDSALRRVCPDRIDLLLCGIVFLGVLCLTPEMEWHNDYTKGVALGLLSACFLALRQTLHTKTRTRSASGLVLLFYQLIGIGLLFTFSGATTDTSALSTNGSALLLLGVAFTAAPHFLNVSALRVLEAKTLLIITSLMLPYGILLSALLLDEIPTAMTLLGCGLVLFAATAENFRAAQ